MCLGGMARQQKCRHTHRRRLNLTRTQSIRHVYLIARKDSNQEETGRFHVHRLSAHHDRCLWGGGPSVVGIIVLGSSGTPSSRRANIGITWGEVLVLPRCPSISWEDQGVNAPPVWARSARQCRRCCVLADCMGSTTDWPAARSAERCRSRSESSSGPRGYHIQFGECQFCSNPVFSLAAYSWVCATNQYALHGIRRPRQTQQRKRQHCDSFS